MENNKNIYNHFLGTLSGEQWKRIGLNPRSGVAAALFSIYSSDSIGIGELADLPLLVDWCNKTGMSIIQLLPMNDVGFNFRPYDAQSSFALDPMFLSLSNLVETDIAPFKNDLKNLKNEFPAGKERVNYQIKAAKLKLLEKIFRETSLENNPNFETFQQNQAFWLEDYALFKVIKQRHEEMAWEGWGSDLKHKNDETICSFKETYHDQLLFHYWLQWQLFEQFLKAKKYASDHNVFLMGDLPFLVSRDSADVWSHQNNFKLSLSAGAPPDMLYSNGQRWGMPPYNWEKIAEHNYDYVIEKLKYAENFYDIFRIDHVVGIFRVWTIALSEPLEHGGLNGAFDPNDEHLWEDHGRRLLSVMIKNTKMLACAEDLGVVPACSNKVLDELGIPGIDVQRWKRDWNTTRDFSHPKKYRMNSLATIGTHDMSSLAGWWNFEAGTIDEGLFKRKCRERNIPYEAIKEKLFDIKCSFHGRLRWKHEINSAERMLNILHLDEPSARDFIDLYAGTFDEQEKFLKFLNLPETSLEITPMFIKKTLEKILESSSVFSIQLIHDWFSLDTLFVDDPWDLRINFPGTLSDKNWTLVMPLSLEDMLELPINEAIKTINKQSGRYV